MSGQNGAQPLLDETVGEIAATIRGATALFRRHDIDFYCGGDAMLADALAEGGLESAAIEREIEELASKAGGVKTPRETPDLIEFIRTRFHEKHRRDLHELGALSRRVEKVHAAHPAVPQGLADELKRTAFELEIHMRKEEVFLFPTMLNAPGLQLVAAIHYLRREHRDHGARFRKLRKLANDFDPPPDASPSWKALYSGVDGFVEDVMEHIHLENNVLFPRFERHFEL